MSNLTFGQALEHIKNGVHMQRSGWNGKGLYIFLIGTNTSIPGIGGWVYTNGKNDNMSLRPFIAMKTVDEEVVPWVASQTDLLAEDWQTAF